MRATYTDGFKQHAVQKALQRDPGVSLQGVARELGCGYSTLHRWISAHRMDGDALGQTSRTTPGTPMPNTNPPLTTAQKLELVIACDSLDEEALGAHCRRQGVYPHQVAQWKLDFARGVAQEPSTPHPSETKPLKQQVKALKRELRRKEKALAEAAALLVLQKKVQTLWHDDEAD